MSQISKEKIRNALKKSEAELSDRSGRSWFNLHYRRFEETLSTILRLVPYSGKIVELGSYPGHLTLALKNLGYDVVGVDVAPQRFIQKMKKEGIQVIEFDLEKIPLPFGNNHFDCALATEVIEHISPEKATPLLNEIYRILRSGGLLVLSTPNASTIDNGLLKIMGKDESCEEHKKEYTLTEMKKALTDSNFEIIKKWYSLNRDVVTHAIPDAYFSREHVFIGFLRYPFWKNFGRAATLPSKYLYPPFRSTMFVIAKKSH